MVLTKAELLSSLKLEVRILVHLCGKVRPEMLDYRPTAKQRSTIELLRYLAVMGRVWLPATKAGEFSREAWNAEEAKTAAMDFEAVVESLEALKAFYVAALAGYTDEDLRGEVEMFETRMSRGQWLVNLVLCGHAAYRMQLFCYLKACGREELNTANLWAGVDAAM